MALALVWGFLFHYFDNFFAVFDKELKTVQFESKFDDICNNLGMKVSQPKKQNRHIMDFLGLEFDMIKIEKQLPKDKLDKAIKGVNNIFKKKRSTTHKKFQSFVGLLFFMAKIKLPDRAFL